MNHEIFGHAFEGPIDWTFNPTTETSRDNEWSWSLFRTIFWQPLARAYALSKDERYVKEFADQFRSFYEAWPAQKFIDWDEMDRSSPFPGHAWRTIEAGIRIYTTWLPCLEVFRSSPSFDEETWKLFLLSIHDHGTFLLKHYSNHSRSSNWLSMEASALLQLGIMFPEMVDAKQWFAEGYRRVMHEIAYCFDNDGAHMEHTPIYHLVAAIAFLQATQLCTKNGIPIAPYAMTLHERSAEYVMGMIKPDFSTPMIGDADRTSLLTRIADPSIFEGMNLSFFPDDLNELRAYYALMANLTGRKDFLYFASGGLDGEAPEQLDFQFDESGIYCMRTGWTDKDSYLHLLGVKLERGERSTHSHNDTAHLELMVEGEDILVDSGRYIYNSSIWKDWRHYFLSALAHNTLYVDDHEMGTLPNISRVRGVRTIRHRFDRSDSYLLMDISHNGYVYMDDPIFHRRKVAFLLGSKATIIVDHVTGLGKADHDIRFVWNFASNNLVQKHQARAVFTTDKGSVFNKYTIATHRQTRTSILKRDSTAFIAKEDKQWKSFLYCGSEDPKGGWISYGYPVRESRGQIQDCFNMRAPMMVVTVIAFEELNVSISAEDQCFRLSVGDAVITGDLETMEINI